MSEVFQDTVQTAKDPDALGPMSKKDVEDVVRTLMDDARDFNETELSDVRILADSYYQGKTRLKSVKGRSKVVVSKVRDGIKSVIPSIGRIFTSTDTIAEFYSDAEEDEKLCTDATLYCNSVFWKNGGYQALIEGATDALKARIGVVLVDVEDYDVPVHAEYELKNGATIEEVSEEVDGDITEASETEFVATSMSKRTKWSLLPIPPEEFFVDSDATTLEDSRLSAWSRNVRIYELIEKGYKYSDIEDADPYEEDDEKNERRGFDEDSDETPKDPTSRKVLFTQAYVRVDADGDGTAELRKICTVGTKYKILSDEPVNFRKFAIFKADFQPHVFHPISLAEDLVQDQDAQTALLRSIIDNTAMTNSPRTAVNEQVVNLDDVENGEIGAIVRVKQMGQIEELTTPFVAGQTLPVLQHMEQVSEQRSGITRLSQGLDTDALQSTSRVAAAAAVQGADSRLETIARNIGETGVKDIFMCILRCAMHHVKTSQSVPTMQGFVNVNPQFWHDQVSVRCNVGLGSGRIDEKKMALTSLLPFQQQIVEKYGAANPISGWSNVRETLRSIMRLSGVHNFQAYFPYVDQNKLMEMDQQANAANAEKAQAAKQMQQAQMGQAQAMVDMVKVEQQKNMLKHQQAMADMQRKYDEQLQNMQAEIMTLKADSRLKMTDMYLKDDRERDKMDMEYSARAKEVEFSAQEIAKTELKVAAPRGNGQIQ